MKRLLILTPLILTALTLTALPSLGADYYVATWGSDSSCNGTTNDTPVDAPDCAWETIAHAYGQVSCGDTINVAAGAYAESRLTLGKSCTSGNEVQIVGAGSTSTSWFPGGALVDTSSCSVESAGVYTCPIPTDGMTTRGSRPLCFLNNIAGTLDWEDESGTSGVHGSLSGYMCMAYATTTSNVDSIEGSFTIDGTDYRIHSYLNESLNTTQSFAQFVAPNTAAVTAQACLPVTGDYNVVKDITIGGLCEIGIYFQAGATHNTFQDVIAYGGSTWNYGAETQLIDYRQLHAARRPTNGAGYNCSNFSCGPGVGPFDVNSYGIVTSSSASDWYYQDIENYFSREGATFTGTAHGGTVSGMKTHGGWNHGFKVQDNAYDILFENVVSYNNQEALFLADCVYDIEMRHSSFGKAILIHDNTQGGSCTNQPTGPQQGPQNVDFYNNIIYNVTWLSNFGDARSGARGHDFDYNVYLGDFPGGGGPQAGAWQYHSPTSSHIKDMSSWQNWASDTCTDCTRDPNGQEAPTIEGEYATHCANGDDGTCDFHLESGATSRDAGGAAHITSTGLDMDGDSRDVVTPDSGADEYTAATPACDDGLDNDGDGSTDYPNDTNCSSAADTSESECGDNDAEGTAEVCDGTDLDGESCSSQGFDSGTLACLANCSGFDTSGCENDPPPAPTITLTLTGVKASGIEIP